MFRIFVDNTERWVAIEIEAEVDIRDAERIWQERRRSPSDGYRTEAGRY